MRIQHNIMAMSAYRNYTNNVSAMKKNLEKLSSGYKINRAGDDAAGLAISEKMRAQISGLEAATKNAKDGISLVQTAEGALTEVHDMLNRMVTLATQSANGTYDVNTDRAQMQKEINQLREEIDRIADSANFNGIKLFDGSMDPATTGIGATEAVEGSVTSVVTSSVGSTLGSSTIQHQTGAAAKATEFGVDLHDVAFSNNAGESLEITVGTDKFTLAGGAHTGTAGADKPLTAADIVDAFVAGKFTDSEGNTVTAATTSVNGSKFNVTDNGTGLKFTLVNGEDPIQGDMNVTVAGKAGNVWTTGAYTAGVEGNEGSDGTGTAVTYGDSKIKVVASVGDKSVTFGKDNGGTIEEETIAYDADIDALVTKIENLVDADGKKLSDSFDVAKTDDGEITLTAKNGGDKVTAFTFTPDATPSGTAHANHPASAPTMTAGTNKAGDAPVTGDWNKTTTITESGNVKGNSRIASGVATLSASTFTNGNTIRVGDKTYTVSTDAADKGTGAGTSGKIYVGDLNVSTADGLKKAIDRLSVQTADNEVWTIGHGTTAGQVTFVEKVDATGKSYTEQKTGADGKLATGAFDLTKEAVIKSTFGTVTGAKAATTGENGKQLVLQIGDTADEYNQLKVTMKDMHVDKIGQALKADGTVDTSVVGGDLTIGSIRIDNQDDAAKALDVIKRAINQVSDMRGTLGATQNRLDHTINNLSVMTENIQDAESTIRDVDVAEEMMAYTKNNILIQSAQAMLAQANQVPQGVLQLLG